MKKFKVGEKIKVIKYRNAHFDGIIHKMDPILSANMKRTIGYWYIIKPCVTIEYYCKKGELSLFTRHDIVKLGDKDGQETCETKKD